MTQNLLKIFCRIFLLFIFCGISPDAPDFNQQWALKNTGQTVNGISGVPGIDINIIPFWNSLGEAPGSNDMAVALISSGIYYSHEDFNFGSITTVSESEGKDLSTCDIYEYTNGERFCAVPHTGNSSNDKVGFGTSVAGIIGAIGDNHKGIAGIMWRGKMIPIKIGALNGDITMDELISAIKYATHLKKNYRKTQMNPPEVPEGDGKSANVRVMVATLGLRQVCNQSLHDAITEAEEADILIVADAGNLAANLKQSVHQSPAECGGNNFISVAAINNKGELHRTVSGNVCFGTSYGSETVDIAAPGVSIRSTSIRGGGYGDVSGTSYAAAHVAGAAALLFAKKPDLTAIQAKDIILQTANHSLLPCNHAAPDLPGCPESRLPNVCEDTVSGGMLDVSGAISVAIDSPIYTPVPTATSTTLPGSPGNDPGSDLCPNNISKVAPGACGCDLEDTDLNANGIVDCLYNTEAVFAFNTLKKEIKNLKKLSGNKKKDKPIKADRATLNTHTKDLVAYIKMNNVLITVKPKKNLTKLTTALQKAISELLEAAPSDFETAKAQALKVLNTVSKAIA